MGYTSVFINAIVETLMVIYVYQNEKRMKEIAANHVNQKTEKKNEYTSENSCKVWCFQTHNNTLLNSPCKRNITTAILNSHSDMLQEIFKAVRKDNSTIMLPEVAHGKPAEQSSVYGGVHSAPRAVDGNLNTIMHTNLEQSPYWMVDLGKNFSNKEDRNLQRN
ncbi:unnamed protein product [Mytilus edulis]|uniref:Uncharacterized protein n=1 Tax=Mytilus edulis TaxID=6550 RepID=A0A8S3RYR9_MYTED|nr:unnamed protein product [Mytilus edulis]